MNETKIEITADVAVELARIFGFSPFDCECLIEFQRTVHEVYSGDGISTPKKLVDISGFERFYLVVRPK